MESSIFEVDGSLYEGGGQIMRVALCLGIIKQIPVTIKNIRAGRDRPGLARSHLASVLILQQICNGRLENAELGSTTLTLYPSQISSGTFIADCGSSGSITLMLQAILPVLIKTSSILILRGGTDVPFSPTTHFIQNSLQPFLNKIGVKFSYEVKRYGFNPIGRGEVEVRTELCEEINGIDILYNKISRNIEAEIVYSRKSKGNMNYDEEIRKVVERVVNELEVNREIISVREVDAECHGVVVNVWNKSENGCFYHKSEVGIFKGKNEWEKPCRDLKNCIESEACICEELQDQLLIFLAMASSPSRIKINQATDHSLAVIELINRVGLARISMNEGILEIIPQSR
ncbi:unnamed protein product [Blepharisma stoltei]|uniref:RNA 3'-terminal phosphate cyclase domain-containing protein n=1 Tax=Blepharisma stoltei TaxID=1481888 RepID=A0AAU9KAG8_9CILI|nr:unnamed protein product [Blepharisma stoltei]